MPTVNITSTVFSNSSALLPYYHRSITKNTSPYCVTINAFHIFVSRIYTPTFVTVFPYFINTCMHWEWPPYIFHSRNPFEFTARRFFGGFLSGALARHWCTGQRHIDRGGCDCCEMEFFWVEKHSKVVPVAMVNSFSDCVIVWLCI